MRLPDRLRLLQDLSGLTQTELARRLDVSFVSFNRWVNGKAVPRPAAQRRIDRLLGEVEGSTAVTSTRRRPCSTSFVCSRCPTRPGTRYTRGLSREAFGHDEMVVDAVVRELEIIGEAARNVSADCPAAHPEIPSPT